MKRTKPKHPAEWAEVAKVPCDRPHVSSFIGVAVQTSLLYLIGRRTMYSQTLKRHRDAVCVLYVHPVLSEDSAYQPAPQREQDAVHGSLLGLAFKVGVR